MKKEFAISIAICTLVKKNTDLNIDLMDKILFAITIKMERIFAYISARKLIFTFAVMSMNEIYSFI